MPYSESDYKVSVIMPVYNAGKYLERAVESVIHLPATGELILIDDASEDNSWQICKRLEEKYNHIRMLQHEDKKNHGPSISRNLGIVNASCHYISFLDADDYYLNNRFDIESKIFEQFPEADGVYGFTLAQYESEKAKQIFAQTDILERSTFSEIIAPEKLFTALIFGGFGSFHISGITIKKKLLQKTGVFNPKLRYGEDTELWYKISLLGKIISGSIYEPVAIRYVHETNSIHQTEKIKVSRKLMYQELFNWSIKKSSPFYVKNAFFNALHPYTNKYKYSQLKLLITETIKKPTLLLSSFFYKKINLILKSAKK